MNQMRYSILFAAFAACAFVAPSARAAEPTDFEKKIVATPSATVLATIGQSTFADFPVLVRLPAAASALLQAADGTDLLVKDENGTACPFEVDTFGPSGATLVWVKVPSLSASTELTVYLGGAANQDNNPADVWSRYVAVVHGSGSITNSVANGLAVTAGSAAVTASADAGKVGGGINKSSYNSIGVNVANPSGTLANSGKFSVSVWFKRSGNGGGDNGTHILGASQQGWGDSGFLWLQEQGKYISVAAPGSHQWSSGQYTLPDGAWAHAAFVYESGVSLTSYFNGAQDQTKASPGNLVNSAATWTFGSYQNTASGDSFKGDMDELRIFNGVASGDWIALEYATMADAAFFAYGDVGPVDPTATVFETPTAVRNANGSYTVSVVLSENNGDVGVIYDAGTVSITNIVAQNAAPNTYTDTPANLASGTTYAFAAYGRNASNTEVVKKGGVFYNGDISVAKISDATENDLVPGVFRISRADTAHDLSVAYTVGGTAIAGQTYEALSGTATIPAGASFVDIEVVPKMDSATTVDTTVSVTLAAGLYGIDAQAGSAELTVGNLVAPSGYNTWIAASAGLASVGSNWSEGHCPTAQEKVLFDGRFSTADCQWDSAASATVASWTQRSDYTGTVQIDTTYDDTFPALNVTGTVEIYGGKWTHRINEAADGQKYHLKAIIGGDLLLGYGCTITAEMKGYWAQQYPAGSTYSAHAASGDGFANIYGNVYRPADLGAGSSSSGSASDNKSGGGAVWLEVGGEAMLEGTINVRGRQFDGSNTACGSVYLKAKRCKGDGFILANFLASSYYNGNRGSGGRVAIELTEATTLGLPVANVKINGINAGGSGGGGGTFYLKTADPSKPNGTLYLDDQRNKSYGARWHNPQAITAIPAGETWTFDAIVISGYGMLAVPVGTTLNLPNGPMSVSASSTRKGGIRYDGGTINWGSAPYEFASNWIFQANAPYAFNGDVIVHSGGAIGCLQFQGKTDFSNATKCDITVNGNLTIESGGYLYANGGGPDMNINRNTVSYHGGQSAGAEGNQAYDSIFNPRLPGYGIASGDQATSAPGGGLLLVNVTGAFVNNGLVTANGSSASDAGASGGSISITAGTLSGKGLFKADSASGNSGTAGGGRIAVRLTDGDFAAGAEARFTASGATIFKHMVSDKSSSAGTVYLQGMRDGEKGGTIYVRNDRRPEDNITYTPIPSGVTRGGVEPDAVADFKKASLAIGNCGRVKLFADIRMNGLQMETGTALDLNGMTLTVNEAQLGGTRLALGTYTADILPEYLVDFVAGGKLVVCGGGFSISIR